MSSGKDWDRMLDTGKLSPAYFWTYKSASWCLLRFAVELISWILIFGKIFQGHLKIFRVLRWHSLNLHPYSFFFFFCTHFILSRVLGLFFFAYDHVLPPNLMHNFLVKLSMELVNWIDWKIAFGHGGLEKGTTTSR